MENDVSKKLDIALTREGDRFFSPSANMYENTALISKRARQVLSNRRSSFATDIEVLVGEEDFGDELYSLKRAKLSKKYEKMAKPVVVATKEAYEGELIYGYASTEEGTFV